MSHLEKKGHTFKNVPHLKKWVALGKMGHNWKNVSPFGIMGHTLKNVSQLEKWVILVKMEQS